MFEERDKVDPNDRAPLDAENTALDEEQGDLAREEADLRAALEDAKAPAPTVEEHAREKYTNISALLSGPSDAIPTLGDYDAIKAEEQELARYLEQYDKADAAEPDPAPTEEDEEIGSFRLGKCKYCGREWGVTLEGAREGGFPTQRTADAAATRLCDCEEAVANRAPVIGVAMAVTTGACRYCGQIQEVGPHPSQAAADDTATEVCNCPTARQERRVHEQVADACERVQRLFGDDAESLGFKPIPDEAVGLLENVVEMIARGPISSASLNVRGRCKAKFSVTSKGKIKVSRSETRSCYPEEYDLFREYQREKASLEREMSADYDRLCEKHGNLCKKILDATTVSEATIYAEDKPAEVEKVISIADHAAMMDARNLAEEWFS